MNIILLGAPGSGKGTIAKKLVENYNLEHISTGDLIRAEIALNSKLGLEMKAILNKGNLVPDEHVINLLKKKIDSISGKGIILDGFPRTVVQAEFLEKFCNIDNVFYLKISLSEAIDRIMGRLICTNCGHISHKKWTSDGICPVCKNKLITRSDDTEESVAQRMAVYEKTTAPLIDFYTKANLLTAVDASESSDNAYEQIKKVMVKR